MRHNLNGDDGDPIIYANAQKTRMNTKLKMDQNCEQIETNKDVLFGFVEKFF